MAHDFSNIKDNRKSDLSNILFHNFPFYNVCNQHRAAVENDNWGMVFYYKFMHRLLEAASSAYPHRMSEQLENMAIKEPADALTGLKAILELDRKYNPDDVERLTKVINTFEEIAKPIPFP